MIRMLIMVVAVVVLPVGLANQWLLQLPFSSSQGAMLLLPAAAAATANKVWVVVEEDNNNTIVLPALQPGFLVSRCNRPTQLHCRKGLDQEGLILLFSGVALCPTTEVRKAPPAAARLLE